MPSTPIPDAGGDPDVAQVGFNRLELATLISGIDELANTREPTFAERNCRDRLIAAMGTLTPPDAA